jgi:hypothetical protein
MLDASRYFARTGVVGWQMLPNGFPPWQTLIPPVRGLRPEAALPDDPHASE